MIIPIVSGTGQRIDHDTDEANEIRLGVLCENIPAELWEMFSDADTGGYRDGHGRDGCCNRPAVGGGTLPDGRAGR